MGCDDKRRLRALRLRLQPGRSWNEAFQGQLVTRSYSIVLTRRRGRRRDPVEGSDTNECTWHLQTAVRSRDTRSQSLSFQGELRGHGR